MPKPYSNEEEMQEEPEYTGEDTGEDTGQVTGEDTGEDTGVAPDGDVIPDNPDESQAIEDEFIDEDELELGEPQKLQLDAYRDNATILVFSEESQAAVLQSLQAGDNPIDSVAQTAFLLHSRLEQSLAETGENMTEVTMLLGAAHLVSELIYLAEIAGLYQLNNQDRLEAFRHAAMKYFEAGLKDGSIDPVKLQKEIEPLMTKEQREAGLGAMEQFGVMKTPPPSNKGGMTQAPPQQNNGGGQFQASGILGGGENGV